jgi:SulP family sulfate permease
MDDGLAALIVTVMLIPQSLAYAMLAGLPPEMGLYASMLPLVAYAVFGTSTTLSVGPVAVVSLMTAAAIGQFAEAGFQSNLALGAAFLFKRQVQIFQAGFGLCQVDFAGQFGRQLALFFNAGEDAGAALVEFAQVAQALFQIAQLRVV